MITIFYRDVDKTKITRADLKEKLMKLPAAQDVVPKNTLLATKRDGLWSRFGIGGKKVHIINLDLQVSKWKGLSLYWSTD